MQATGPAPLEQGWAYGDALAAASGVRIRRALVVRSGATVATLQATERRLPAGFSLIRLVRGPVAGTGGDPVAGAEIAAGIRAALPLRSRCLLFWMPDCAEDAAPALLRPLGKRPMTTGYTTSWLDMAEDPGGLRASLRSNWRNQLRNAEKNPPCLRRTATAGDVERFLAGYNADRRRKRYRGPPEKLVRTLFEAFGDDALLLQAANGPETDAAALFLRHGTSATYFLSWSTPAGRQRNAANLLLWTAVQDLRAAGVRWLDLGGLDARAPGIARFKLGLGGTAVRYSGTWF